jgi:AAA+ superfamily predicted ATPase
VGIEDVKLNIDSIRQDLIWLGEVIEKRFDSYFQNKEKPFELSDHPAPAYDLDCPYCRLINDNDLSGEERVLLLLALAPHVNPSMLDVFFTKNTSFDRTFTEFGGLKADFHSGFLPTLETASFILYEKDFLKRFAMLDLFGNEHVFFKQNILKINVVKQEESAFNGSIILSDEWLSILLKGRTFLPQYSSAFPATRLITKLDWEDAIYDQSTKSELNDIISWVENSDKILANENLKKYLKQGYRALFYGPPGTGKTMTTALLGKRTGLDVYQVDLSAVVSKYIGETEKNLASLFDTAENKNWILFFDEADSLFGKRTAVQSSNDQHSNQQVGYLLQRIEDYNGIVILASNFKDNIDAAFLRRFQSVVFLAKPNVEQRRRIWEKYFEATFDLKEVDFEQIAVDYEITGGGIVNVLRHCAIVAQKRGDQSIYEEDIVSGIKKEYLKQGMTV